MTRAEFAGYVQREHDKLLRFVRSRIARAEDAEDVLQKALLKLFQVCHAIHADNPDPFFFTTLRTAIIDHWRERGRRPTEAELSDQMAAASPGNLLPREDEATEQRCRQAILQVIAALTPRERKAFRAFWRARGDREEALAELAVAAAGKEEKYRVYDGPLYHAKRKLAAGLQTETALLADVGYARVWELVYEVLGGDTA
jgi:RNA polymerase sigma factor (sigma-70 family)